MSDSNKISTAPAGAKPETLETLARRAAGRPVKQSGDVCIGKLPTRGGELVVWSSQDSKQFCQIAGTSARKLGYLPWQEVRDFIRDHLDPQVRGVEPAEIESLLQSGQGPTALEEARPAQGRERGTVVELREIRPRAFFWETLREVLPAGRLKLGK
ncbi:MAG: hypothetical protein U1F66_06850 [bacterium]